MKELYAYIDNTYNDEIKQNNSEWDDYYNLDALKRNCNTIELGNGEGLLVIISNALIIQFFVLEWCCSVDDNYGKIIYYGQGTSGNLREMRHTYFNPYLFYINATLIENSFKELRKYFDI